MATALVEVQEFSPETGWDLPKTIDLSQDREIESEFCRDLLVRIALLELIAGTEYL